MKLSSLTVWVDRLLAALWLGAGVFLISVAAPAAFRFAGTPTDAANVVGTMLSRWHYLSLIAPVWLLFREMRRQDSRTAATIVLTVALFAAAGQVAADLAAARIRRTAPTPISLMKRSDPVRQRFGRLHGIASLLLLVQMAAAAVHVARDEKG